MGLSDVSATLDFEALRLRIEAIEDRLEGRRSRACSRARACACSRARAASSGPHEVVVDTVDGPVELEADVVLLATGSRPRIPDWAPIDGAPGAHHPRRLPAARAARAPDRDRVRRHRRGVRPHVLGVRVPGHPHRQPPAGAAPEGSRGRRRPRGGLPAPRRPAVQGGPGRAASRSRRRRWRRRGVLRRRARRRRHPRAAGHRLDPQLRDARARRGRRRVTTAATSSVNHNCQSSVPHIYAAGDLSGKLPLSSVASMQGRKIAEHAMGLHVGPHRHLDYEKAASAIFTVPEIADVGLAEADAFAEGRKIRVTKVPFSANAKALIENDPRGFVKIVSRPGHRRGARRIDRRPPRGRAHLGHRPRGHRRARGSPTSSRACSCTRRWPRRCSDAAE